MEGWDQTHLGVRLVRVSYKGDAAGCEHADAVNLAPLSDRRRSACKVTVVIRVVYLCEMPGHHFFNIICNTVN